MAEDVRQALEAYAAEPWVTDDDRRIVTEAFAPRAFDALRKLLDMADAGLSIRPSAVRREIADAITPDMAMEDR